MKLLDTGLGEHRRAERGRPREKAEWPLHAVEPRPDALRDLRPDDIVLTTFGLYAVGGTSGPTRESTIRRAGDLQTPEIPLLQRRLRAILSRARGSPA